MRPIGIDPGGGFFLLMIVVGASEWKDRTHSSLTPASTRHCATRVSPGHVLQGSARVSTSPAQGGLSYEPAFVEALQAQQRARLEETLSAAERLLSAKGLVPQ